MEIGYYYETKWVQETSYLTEFINVTFLALIHGYERRNIETMDATFFKGKASLLLLFFFSFQLYPSVKRDFTYPNSRNSLSRTILALFLISGRYLPLPLTCIYISSI